MLKDRTSEVIKYQRAKTETYYCYYYYYYIINNLKIINTIKNTVLDINEYIFHQKSKSIIFSTANEQRHERNYPLSKVHIIHSPHTLLKNQTSLTLTISSGFPCTGRQSLKANVQRSNVYKTTRIKVERRPGNVERKGGGVTTETLQLHSVGAEILEQPIHQPHP